MNPVKRLDSVGAMKDNRQERILQEITAHCTAIVTRICNSYQYVLKIYSKKILLLCIPIIGLISISLTPVCCKTR